MWSGQYFSNRFRTGDKNKGCDAKNCATIYGSELMSNPRLDEPFEWVGCLKAKKVDAAGLFPDQVRFLIIASLAAKSSMVNLEIGEASTSLASPTIATQNLFAELVVGARREANTRSFFCGRQAAFPMAWCRNSFLCSAGRNWKTRTSARSRMFGSALSRFAPATKSAQIISKQ